jgi:signal peptidase II
MNRGIRRWVLIVAVAVPGFLADWWTKALVLDALEPGSVRQVAGQWLEWTLTFNRGALFGLNPADWIEGFPTRAFYVVFSLLAVGAMAWYYKTLDPVRHRLARWGVALVLPGAAGNFVDRILRPGVVDFIRVDLGFWPLNPWPVFNVADIWISVGVGLLVLDMIRSDLRERRERRTGGEIKDGPVVRGSRRRRR